ncbi:MAG TPA: hypothetical protein PKG95_05530 [Anaerolineaceae bacterium]|nr:hypothetical protein [Anaerolineaceae bacterium]
MFKKFRLTMSLIVLLLATLACGLPAIPTPPPGDVIETNVAATVESLFSDATPTAADLAAATPVEPRATETPAPLDTPIPAAAGELQVVFVQTGNLWLWRAGGGAVQLTSDGGAAQARLSPDGLKVAYSRWMTEFNKELWLINSDGTGNRMLLSAEDIASLDTEKSLSLYDFWWLPDSQRIGYETQFVVEIGVPRNMDFQVIDTLTGERGTFVPAGQGGNVLASPDGQKLAVTTATDIRVIELATGLQRMLLSYPFIYTYSEWAYIPTPVWSNDSESLGVIIPPQESLGVETVSGTLWVVPLRAAPYAAAEVHLSPIFLGPYLSVAPSLNYYLHGTGNEPGLTQVNLGTVIPPLTQTLMGGELGPNRWAADSGHYFLTQTDGDGGSTLYVAAPGSAPLVLAGDVQSESVRWVGTDQLIFIRVASGSRELHLVTLTGTDTLIVVGGDDLSFDIRQ